MSSKKIPAGEFKAKCLQIMEDVRRKRRKITITKRNVPIAELGPVEGKDEPAFGSLRGTVHILGNIIDSVDEVWDANS
ncbi:MAG: type II toxin-antitoxin system prevent-host-death family antitoxin [Chlamydiota bacterium]